MYMCRDYYSIERGKVVETHSPPPRRMTTIPTKPRPSICRLDLHYISDTLLVRNTIIMKLNFDTIPCVRYWVKPGRLGQFFERSYKSLRKDGTQWRRLPSVNDLHIHCTIRCIAEGGVILELLAGKIFDIAAHDTSEDLLETYHFETYRG